MRVKANIFARYNHIVINLHKCQIRGALILSGFSNKYKHSMERNKDQKTIYHPCPRFATHWECYAIEYSTLQFVSCHIGLALSQCWAGISDAGPSLIQQWANVACVPDYYV